MTDNKKVKKRSLGSKVKKIITTIVYYLFKYLIKIGIEKVIDTLIN